MGHLVARAFNKNMATGLSRPCWETHCMWDLFALFFTVAFFTVALWYVQGCEKLR